MPIFNKLVRDKIPELFKAEGRSVRFDKLSDEDFARELNRKLLEECQEVIAAADRSWKAEEMADLMEVLYAMADLQGISHMDIEQKRLEKHEARGGFDERFFLKETE